MTYKILVVEDDTNIREYLVDAFKEAGYSVKQTADGAEALKMVKDSPPDLIVLDLGIESISGETVCEEVKKMHPDLPIIILTAKNTSTEVVHGFDLGADDYISKPFETDELLARIRTRLKQKGTSTLEIDDLVVDTSSYEVKRGGKTISLTAKEFKLLEYLILNKGTVF
jgi:DNA-binding response OmpR family regulator